MKAKVAASGLFVLVTSFILMISNTWGWAPQPQGSPQFVDGRMTGNGSIVTGTQVQGDYFMPPGTQLAHDFDLHCDVTEGPNRLTLDIDPPQGRGGRYHLDKLLYSYCWNDPAISAATPSAPFNSMYGQGIGAYDGTAGYCADWEFVDAGDPKPNDRVGKLRVWKPYVAGDCSDGTFVLSSTAGHPLTHGKYETHKE
jgi:hypothetical protein